MFRHQISMRWVFLLTLGSFRDLVRLWQTLVLGNSQWDPLHNHHATREALGSQGPTVIVLTYAGLNPAK